MNEHLNSIPWLKFVTLSAPILSFTTSTSILSFSTLQTPILISTTLNSSPALALRQLRPFFETGKYIFPPSAIISAGLWSILAYFNPEKKLGYGIATAGCLSILPFTSLYMIPVTNNRILELDDRVLENQDGKEDVEKKRGEVNELLGMFLRQNLVRGGMFWIGAVVGLWTILS